MIPSLSSISARLRFRQLSLLVALEECGSVNRAAERLNMTQPGLTKALREVESTFGSELFVRTKQGVYPNELGQCLIRHARLMDADLGHLREQMNGVLRGSGGRVAVGAITGALHSVLIDALAELRRLQPALSIEIRESTSLELLNAIDDGRLDLAIGRTTVTSKVEQFDYEPLMDESVSVAVGPRHALAKARRVTLAQLAKYQWIIYPGNMPLRKLLEREFREAGLDLPPYPIETSSSLVTMLMLKEDPRLVALVSSATMDFCEEHQIASRLPLEIRSRHEPFGIVTRRGARLSPAAEMLVQCLRSAAGKAQPAAQEITPVAAPTPRRRRPAAPP
ncbi:LysR family transcriptional regulator [Xylophilus rhododendri]|uniref:LysR family transcriptional regulator n=1 Tax=Xylophilus rhododendri TaxID=2697032 RepID=A0A857JC09_9BURK|nr:LysR family transcriptional regulator [Xylophilus rhododendri]QHJ00493.1 LysR family transcriptional regulator [Xylophilus rhododendri]